MKIFETRFFIENIDKKYYIWKYQESIGVIEIVKKEKNKIYYKHIKRKHGEEFDIVTGKLIYQRSYKTYWINYESCLMVTIGFWKTNKTRIIFSSDDKNACLDFFDIYNDSKKFGL